MKDLDYRIGPREYAAIILLTVGIKLADTTPTIILQGGGNASWMVPLISMMVSIISLLFILSLLKKHKDKGLIEIINKTLGKPLGFLVNVSLFMIVFIATIVNTKSYVDVLSALFFPKTPSLLLIASLVFSVSYVAKRGFDTISRVAWLIVPYVTVALLLLLLTIWENLNFDFIYPIFGPGPWKLIKEGINYSSVFADIIVLTILFPYVKSFKTFRNASLISLIMSAIGISVFLVAFVIAFSDPAVRNMNYPFQQLSRLATLGVGIQHVESIFLGVWIMASVVHFAVYLYTSSALFSYTLKLKEVETMVLPLGGLVILIGTLIPNISIELEIRKYSLMIASYFIMLLPMVLWGIDKVKGSISK